MRPRLRGGPALLAATLLVSGCSVSDSPFPSTGSLFVTLRATGLGFQTSPEARVQYVRWEVTRLLGTIDPPAIDHPFVTSLPCLIAASPVGDADVRRCGGSGITLASGSAPSVTFRLDVSRVDGIAAIRPDLPDAGDFDGDGVPNATDNCKLVANPLEPDGSGGFAQPKSCYLTDTNGQPTVPDQDRDAIADSIDNCLWYASDDLTDANVNGIGDACERTLPATIPAGGLSLQCVPDPDDEFTINTSAVAQFLIDFTPALSCDVTAGSCSLDLPAVGQPTTIELRRAGSLAVGVCTRVDPL